MNCGKCHTCGADIEIVLDGEEWCPKCEQYQRPRNHGWGGNDTSPCIEVEVGESWALYQQKKEAWHAHLDHMYPDGNY